MGYLLHWAARLLRRLADRRLKPLGITSGCLPVLNALAGRDGMTQKALTAFASIEQPTMAATLVRMERDGLVERRPDPHDRRSVRFFLTAAARGKAEAVAQVVQEVSREALASLPAGERQRFRQHLQTIIVSIEARGDGAD